MVRHAASMQALRESMAGTSVTAAESQSHSSPSLEHYQPSDDAPLQRLDQRKPDMQLCGDDAQTKMLMTRVATGQATPAEQAAFNMHVNNHAAAADPTGGLKILNYGGSEEMLANHQKKARSPLTIQSYGTPSAQSTMLSAQRTDQKRMQARAAQMYKEQDRFLKAQRRSAEEEKQCDLLEQQNRKRILLARQEEVAMASRNQSTKRNAEKYTKPFCDFLTDNPTVFHCVAALKIELAEAGFTELSERSGWDVKPSGKYYVERNGSALIAFVVGGKYEPGNGAAILAGHVDALTAKLKPVSQVPNKAGYLQLGVAPYAGGLNNTWWDRDLGIGGRVLIKEDGKIVSKLVKLDWPIAKIPTLAPHFGAPSAGPFNLETQMVPIIGLDDSESSTGSSSSPAPWSLGSRGPVGSFVSTQPPALVKVIGAALGLSTSQLTNIVNWELELFDIQPAIVGGLNKEFIFAGRIDDKLCSWAALQALIESQSYDTDDSSIIKVVGLFDDEEIGSLLRQGARGNFLPQTIERAVGALADHKVGSDLIGRTYANSFIVSSDVTHAVNPNFLNVYLENHSPQLNVGLSVSADSNGHMTTDSVSTAILQRCADKIGAQLQVFQIRNDSRSGGTVGPMLSAMTGIRAIDAGIPQLSMHSIRATTGALDPGLGVLTFKAFLDGFESVDKEFQV